MNASNNNNNLAVDENQQKLVNLTQKVDEEIGSQMKKIEVQKMEDDLTIKMLEREYTENKRNFVYSKKKLDETRKKASTQSETINQLSQANKAIIEKFNELKRFQNEFLHINIDNAKKTADGCLSKNNMLSNKFQMMIEKENCTKNLYKNIIDQKNKLNNNIQKELEERKTVNDSLNKILTQLNKKIELLTVELTQEKINNNFDELVQQNNKTIMQLDTENEAFQTQFKQEIDHLTHKKNNKMKDLDNNKKSLEEKTIKSSSKLQPELLIMEQKQIALIESLKIAETKYKDIFSEVTKKREIIDLSKKLFENNIESINDEQNKINIELECAKNKFSKDESDMHKEFNSLLSKLEEYKKLSNKVENYEQDLNKLKTLKEKKQEELLNDKDLQDKCKKSSNELKKYEQNILIKCKKQTELNKTMENLQGIKSNIKQKLESLKYEKDIVDNNVAKSTENNKKISQNDKKTIQTVDSEKKLIFSKKEDEQESKSLNSIPKSPKLQSSKSPCNKSIYSFKLYDTDESDDEFILKTMVSDKLEEEKIRDQKKTIYNNDYNDMKDNEKDNQSQSDKLFDDLLSQKTPKSSKASKDTDLFKMPPAYMTPFRKKPTKAKKYF